MRLACNCCSGPYGEAHPLGLIEKRSERFVVQKGQAAQGEQFTYSKTQMQVVKELADQGLASIGTHYCEECNARDMNKPDKHPAHSGDIDKLCLPCALDHAWVYRHHSLVSVATPQIVQTLIKKNEMFEYQVRKAIGAIQLRQAEAQVDSFVYKTLQLLPEKKKR